MPPTLLLLGATGLVGREVLSLALAAPAVTQVIAPTRRRLPVHARLLNPLVDFAALPAAAWWHADAAVCTLGTTLRQAGSPAAFERIDRSYVAAAAAMARNAGTPSFAYNSAVGAHARARSLYLAVKGRTEDDLLALAFPSLTFVRPSLLDGGPRAESRPMETAMLLLARPLRRLIPRRYRPVRTRAVAQSLFAAALAARPGLTVIESEEIGSS